MPKSPQKTSRQDHNYNLAIRIPGWFKNQIIDYCNQKQINLTQFVIVAVQKAMRDGLNIPDPPPAARTLPTTADEIRLWLTGEKILMPCGQTKECAGTKPDRLGGFWFCNQCGIRVR